MLRLRKIKKGASHASGSLPPPFLKGGVEGEREKAFLIFLRRSIPRELALNKYTRG